MVGKGHLKVVDAKLKSRAKVGFPSQVAEPPVAMLAYYKVRSCDDSGVIEFHMYIYPCTCG